MFTLNAALLRLVRIGLVLVLLGAVSGAVVPGGLPLGSVLADEGEGGDDDDDDDDGGDDNDDENQGESNAKDKNDEDDDDDDDSGNGESVVVVPAPNVTPDPEPTSVSTPSPTVESESLGSLRVIAMACQQNPAKDVDWETACTVPVDNARFEVKALDGPLAEWFRVITANSSGVATLDDLPPALYQVEQMSTDWCRAEADRVDAEGNVIIAEGRVTTVWIYNCPVAPK